MQSIIDTIVNFYNAIIAYFVNVFESLKTFLIDLPILAFEKVFGAVIWLFNWASDSCSACFSGAGSLPSNFQGAWDAIAASNIGPTVLYCLHRSGIVGAMHILTCGVLIWSAFKLIGFIKGIF